MWANLHALPTLGRALAAVALVAAGVGGAGPAVAGTSPRETVGGGQLATTGTVVNPVAGVPALPPVSAAAWLVADLDTGQVLAAADPHGQFAPASTLKILTALTVIPRLTPTAQVLATAAEASVDGTRVGIVPGHRYTVSTLLQGMLLDSGNDAATALAVQAGGLAPTIKAMNDEARSLQAYDTTARTVDGLDAAGQFSSAYDLALFARAALALPSFRTDVGTQRVEFAGAGVPPFQISNHNPLLGAVPGVYGVKNGYTTAARASYVGAARRGGHDLVVVVMRTVPDFVPESTALFDWGFAADGRVTPVGSLVGPQQTPVLAPEAVTEQRGAAVSAPLPGGGRTHATWLLDGGLAGGVVVLFAGRLAQVRRRRSVVRHRHRRKPGA